MHHQHSYHFNWIPGALKNNLIEYTVLDFLKDKPAQGHEVVHAIEEKTHGFFSPEPESVHSTLKMLVDMGYAKSTEQDGKKVYTITDEGKEYHNKKREDNFFSSGSCMEGPRIHLKFTGDFPYHRHCGTWA